MANQTEEPSVSSSGSYTANEGEIIHIASHEKMTDETWGSEGDETTNPPKFKIILHATHKTRQERLVEEITLPMQLKRSPMAGYFYGHDKPRLEKKLNRFAWKIEREWGVNPITEREKISTSYH